jgi:hypothetical protein
MPITPAPSVQATVARPVMDNSPSDNRAPRGNGIERPSDSSPPAASGEREILRFQDDGAADAESPGDDQEEVRLRAESPQRRPRPVEANLIAVRSAPARSIAFRSSRPTELSPSVPAESEINITIGRVELRATLPPVAAETARRRAPVVSLEEYLRQRAKGAAR